MVTRKSESRGFALKLPLSAKPADKNKKEIEIIQSRLQPSESLSLADDPDFGSDPYNCTGQFAALAARTRK